VVLVPHYPPKNHITRGGQFTPSLGTTALCVAKLTCICRGIVFLWNCEPLYTELEIRSQTVLGCVNILFLHPNIILCLQQNVFDCFKLWFYDSKWHCLPNVFEHSFTWNRFSRTRVSRLEVEQEVPNTSRRSRYVVLRRCWFWRMADCHCNKS